jgi:hypothetical protein
MSSVLLAIRIGQIQQMSDELLVCRALIKSPQIAFVRESLHDKLKFVGHFVPTSAHERQFYNSGP